ncbi:MAG: EamA family transporter [Pelosinus sp.]|nr:EamA family transporter [Pelosinus sp.]
MYVFSIVLIVASNILYNICQKSTPESVNPMSSLLVTYLTASIITLITFLLFYTDENLVQSIKRLNWTSIVLGITIVGLEFGYLMAYRAGWNISVGSLVSNIILALMLIPVGVLFYQEGFAVNKILGVVLCLVGLILLNKN